MLYRHRSLALSLAASVLVVPLGTSLGAASAAPPTATTPDTTYQVNGRVEAVAYVGSKVVLGGQFTGVAPHGSTAWDTSYRYLAAFDAATGALDTSFRPAPDKPVRDLVADGSAIFIGGEFAKLGAVSRPKIAKLSASGVLDPTFAPKAPNALVSALALDGGRVYLGGAFTTLGGSAGTAVSRVARLDAVTGAVDTSWLPSIANTSKTDAPSVRTLTVGSGWAYVGGYFQQVNGAPRRSAARVSTAGGAALDGWNPRLVVKQSKNRGIVYSIQPAAVNSSSTNTVFVCGDFAYANGAVTTESGGTATPNLAAVDTTTGTLVPNRFWETTDGSVNDCLVADNTLYVTGHFDYAGGRMGYYPGYGCTGATPDTCKIPYTGPRAADGVNPLPLNKLVAFDLGVTNPQGHLALGWVPRMAAIHGGYGLAYSAGSPRRLAVGGDFTKIGNNKTYSQLNFAQFSWN